MFSRSNIDNRFIGEHSINTKGSHMGRIWAVASIVSLLIIIIPVASSWEASDRVMGPIAPEDEDGSFSIIVLPDTQYMTKYYPWMYLNVTEWIRDNQEELDIRFVLHEGDITNNNDRPQWSNASKAMYALNDTVPYTLNTGNHDIGPGGNAADRTTYLNEYFPSGPIENWTSWGGAFEKGKQENTYHLFSGGGRDWLVLALEFAPRDAVIEWANSVVSDHPDRLVLVVTHNYLVGDVHNPIVGYYNVQYDPDGAASGEDIWNDLVRKHRNILGVFCGHITIEEGYLLSYGDNGNSVHQMLANFQQNPMGGAGFLRIVTFNMGDQVMDVKTYSPYLNEFNETAPHNFTIDLKTFEYVNDPPTVLNVQTDLIMFEDQGIAYLDLDGNQRPGTGIFYDPNIEDGDELDFHVFNGTDWVWVGLGRPFIIPYVNISFMPNGTFEIEFPPHHNGPEILLIRAVDSRGDFAQTLQSIDIRPVNDPPIFLDPEDWFYEDPAPIVRNMTITCLEDERLDFRIKAFDPVEPEDTFQFASDDLPTFLVIDNATTGNVSGTPGNGDVGEHLIEFTVDDGGRENSNDSISIIIVVENVNDPPEILTTDPVRETLQDVAYEQNFTAFDPDPTHDILTWELITDADFLSINATTGTLTGIPQDEDVETYPVMVMVSDGSGGKNNISFDLTVLDVYDPLIPMGPSSPIVIDEDHTLFLEIDDWFTAPDGPPIHYMVSSSFSGIVRMMENRTLMISPAENWSGSGNFSIEAFDAFDSAVIVVNLTVLPVNDPPYFVDVLVPNALYTGENGNATAIVSDPDLEYDQGEVLSIYWYMGGFMPMGPTDRLDLSFLTTNRIPGVYELTCVVTDHAGLQVSRAFTIQIIEREELPPGNETEEDEKNGDDELPILSLIVGAAILLVIIIVLMILLASQRRKKFIEE